MGKLSYILGCVTRMDYPELFRTVGKVHKITGKNSVGILADVVKCGLKYGAGFNDYLLCEFYNLTDAQRATYITQQREQHLGQPFKRPGVLPLLRQQKRVLHHLWQVHRPPVAGLWQGHPERI